MILITGATGNIGAELVKLSDYLGPDNPFVRLFAVEPTRKQFIFQELSWWRAILPNRRHSRPLWKM
jgi:FlaA1/EpsC-like NDP-sugar epimerase